LSNRIDLRGLRTSVALMLPDGKGVVDRNLNFVEGHMLDG
jgi:hypothetical protein